MKLPNNKTSWLSLFYVVLFSAAITAGMLIPEDLQQVAKVNWQVVNMGRQIAAVNTTIKPSDVKSIIEKIEAEYGLPAGKMLKLAKCESSLNPNAKHKNTDGTIDRGLFQINSKWHYEVSNDCAYSVECSANWTAQQLKLGKGKMWVCFK